MSDAKKKHILNTVSVKLGCRPSLTALFSRRHHHRRRRRRHPYNSSSSSSKTTTTAAVTFSSSSSDPAESDIKSLRAVQGFGRVGGQSVAVEKDSEDPYLDFRRSMLQMILDKELYSKDDLRELLNCFLQLNSPYYHSLIVRAFTDIWNGGGLCSVTPPPETWSSGDYL